MFRLLAHFFLRRCGAVIEYRVQRITYKDGEASSSKDGTTLLRTEKFSEAVAKFKKVRVGENQAVIIRLVAKVGQRWQEVSIVGGEMEIDYDIDAVNAKAEQKNVSEL